MIAEVRLDNRSHKAGINMDLIGRDEHQYRRTTMVPERAMKTRDIRSLDILHLLKVYEGGIVNTENSVESQQVKGAAQDVALRGARSGLIQFRFAGEKDLPSEMLIDTKVFSPNMFRRAHCGPSCPFDINTLPLLSAAFRLAGEWLSRLFVNATDLVLN